MSAPLRLPSYITDTLRLAEDRPYAMSPACNCILVWHTKGDKRLLLRILYSADIAQREKTDMNVPVVVWRLHYKDPEKQTDGTVYVDTPKCKGIPVFSTMNCNEILSRLHEAAKRYAEYQAEAQAQKMRDEEAERAQEQQRRIAEAERAKELYTQQLQQHIAEAQLKHDKLQAQVEIFQERHTQHEQKLAQAKQKVQERQQKHEIQMREASEENQNLRAQLRAVTQERDTLMQQLSEQSNNTPSLYPCISTQDYQSYIVPDVAPRSHWRGTTQIQCTSASTQASVMDMYKDGIY